VLAELARGSELIELPDGEPVVRLGAASDALYAVVEGSVQVQVPGLPSGVFLTEGDVFGESCLLEGEPRRADVVAHGDLVALRVPSSLLAKVVELHPPMGDVLFELLTRRLIANLMQTSALFNVFDPPTRVELARLFEIRRAAKETVLIEGGKKSDGLYLPLTGRFRVESRDGRPPTIAGPGTMFGQESLISQHAARATVSSVVDMVVLRLPSASFIRVASQFPPALEYLAEMAALPSPPVSGEPLP
jgi:CRP-like cAMP-binding protein